MNKFWTGVKRVAGDGGLDQLEYLCCEADYHEPQTGEHPLPVSFKDKNGKFSFH